MKKLTNHAQFGMLFAIPLFVSMAIVSIVFSFIVYILAFLNKITGTSQAFDWLLFRSKEHSKRLKFRSLLSKIDKNSIK
jgi:hypothetical protein